MGKVKDGADVANTPFLSPQEFGRACSQLERTIARLNDVNFQAQVYGTVSLSPGTDAWETKALSWTS